MWSLLLTKLSQRSSFFILNTLASILKKQFKKLFGGFMFKLLFMGILVSMISNLTGIPASPLYPVVSNQSIKFESTSINQKKFTSFKKYLSSKF